MRIACLDLEGVLVPEIWQAVAARTGIEELKLTTRDIPDYHELMQKRLAILDRERIRLPDIQSVIAGLRPLDGAREFLDELRARMQVIILSDTFEEFAAPLMAMLGFPTLFCNSLTVEPDGRIAEYRLRQEDGKLHAVKALQGINFPVYAAGDSYNDLSMILAADQGAFFRPPDSIVRENPGVPAFTEYRDLLAFLTAPTPAIS